LRKIAILAVVAAMLTIVPTPVQAAGEPAGPAFSDIAGHPAEAELTALGALGVFQGEYGLGGPVDPDGILTRAQFCKVVVEAFGRGTTARGLMGLKPTFSDEVPAWAWGYVNTAVFMGVIKGYEDNTFRADRPVTYGEAVTMLVRAVAGHDDLVPDGLWPYNYLFYGVDNGFTADVNAGFAYLPCTRGDMAKMLFATTQIYTIPPEKSPLEPAAVLEDGERIYRGTLTGFDVRNEDSWVTISGYTTGEEDATPRKLPLAGQVFLVGAETYEELLGQAVLAVADRSGDIVFIQRTEGSLATGLLTAMGSDRHGDYLELDDKTKIYYETPLRVVLNHCYHKDYLEEGTPDQEFDQSDLEVGDELTVNLDENGEAILVYALRWDLVNYRSGDSYAPAEDWLYEVEPSEEAKDRDTRLEFHAQSLFYTLGSEGYTSLGGRTIEVPETARIYINSRLADRDDLRRNDVIKGATFGCFGPFQAPVIAVSATRQEVEGTVVSSRVTYTGASEQRSVTLQTADGTRRTYKVAPEVAGEWYITWAPTGLHTYLLDQDGNLFLDLEYLPVNPIVLVTGLQVEVSGSTTEYEVVTDAEGVEKVYPYDDKDLFKQPDIGRFFVLEVSGATGSVTARHPFGEHALMVVKATGSDSATLKHTDGDGYEFIQAPVAVYAVDSDQGALQEGYWTYTYIGLEGLEEDDHVYWYSVTLDDGTYNPRNTRGCQQNV